MKRKIVPVSFSLNDETENKMLEHIDKKGNRSKYLKKLIYDDMMNVQRLITTTTHYDDPVDEIDIDAMEGFL